MTTQLVSAYTDLDKGQLVEIDTWDAAIYGEVEEWTPEGLQVYFEVESETIPATAQYFVAWEPVVYAVWNEENDGEDGNGEDGFEDGAGGEANPQEPDAELGFPGSGNAGEQPAEAQERRNSD